MPDRSSVTRTYAGHSGAAESNALYRLHPAKGQTGLSVAFDLPTQTGYTPMWLLALYQVVAEEQGADVAALQGTIQNDIVKDYLSRGTYAFPPGPSMR